MREATADKIAMPTMRLAHNRMMFARLIVAMLTLRWLAGIGENIGVPGLSELVAMAMLAIFGIIFLLDPRIARSSLYVVCGFLGWLLVATHSYLANDVGSPSDALALAALLTLYALFSNAVALHIRDLQFLPVVGWFLKTFVLAGFALAVQQVAAGTGFVEDGKEQIMRAFGSDVHPVSFALQMVIAIVGLEVVRLKTGRSFAFSPALLLAAGVVAVYLTFARTAWFMLPVVLGYAVFVRSGWKGRAGVVFASVAVVGAISLISDRFADLASLPFFLSNFSLENLVFDYRYIDNSIAWRMVNWAFGLQQAVQQPWLGYGPGQSAVASQFHLEMHNIFLEQFFEGGILGLAAFLVLVAGLIRMHRRLPASTLADVQATNLVNGLGLALFLAVFVSTSLVDQLMTVLLYLLVLGIAAIPTVAGHYSKAARKARMLSP